MGTFTRHTYQIVFHTKNWEPTLTETHREELFTYISGIMMKKNCYVYQVGGFDNHIHIIADIPPSIAVSHLIKDVKLAYTSLIKLKYMFPNFNGWNEGFGSFTYGPDARKNLINYVLNQKEHHKKETPFEEFKRLLKEFEIEYQDKYL